MSRIGRRSSRLLTNNRFARSFTLKKQAVGDRSDSTGEWVPGNTTETSLKGSIQPATKSQRLQLPEAERLDEAIAVYFKTTDRDDIRPLRIGTAQTDSDIIAIDNLNWAVRAADDWSDFGHITAICTRLEAQNG